jgi:hypothetical protein
MLLGGHNISKGPADHLLARVAQQFDPGRVDIDQTSTSIESLVCQRSLLIIELISHDVCQDRCFCHPLPFDSSIENPLTVFYTKSGGEPVARGFPCPGRSALGDHTA